MDLDAAPEERAGARHRCDQSATRSARQPGILARPCVAGKGIDERSLRLGHDFWFEALGFAVLRVAKARDNITSRRISERQGMRLIGVEERDYVCGRLPSEIWEITARDGGRGRRDSATTRRRYLCR